MTTQGHGRRLLAAFEALERFPALDASRVRLLELLHAPARTADLVSVAESDPALTLTLLRAATVGAKRRRRIASVPWALDVLTPGAVEAAVRTTPTFDFFEHAPPWGELPERFRLHALATQRASERLARELDYPDRGELAVAALLHDIGKLVLSHAYPSYLESVRADSATPEARLERERRELGIDHAVVGGVLARRWALPDRLAAVIEHHHSDQGSGAAAIVRLADMLAHYERADPLDPGRLVRAARAAGLSTATLRTLLRELPGAGFGGRRKVEPSPLSPRETEVVRRLARGLTVAKIAADLQVTESTVRTHLHSAYERLGVVDRAQAVLLATRQGWL